jgi:hypothetical protein
VRPGLIFLLLLAAPAVWSQTAGSPAELVSTCIDSGETDSYGLQELEEVCPGIEHALVELGYSPFISEDQLEQLSIASLVDLQRLADRYAERPAAAISTDSLVPIIKSLDDARQAERPQTWFERVKKWLRNVFDRHEDESQSWLNRWVEGVQVPEAVTRAIVYCLVILVIGLAIGVLINELRAARVLGRAGAKAKRSDSKADATPTAAEPTLADLENVTPADRPSVLLRLLVATLVQRGRLRADRSLTHRELATRASFDEDAQRECFSRVTALSERTVYGDVRAPSEEIESVVQAGRALMSKIAASPVASTQVVAPQGIGQGAGK